MSLDVCLSTLHGWANPPAVCCFRWACVVTRLDVRPTHACVYGHKMTLLTAANKASGTLRIKSGAPAEKGRRLTDTCCGGCRFAQVSKAQMHLDSTRAERTKREEQAEHAALQAYAARSAATEAETAASELMADVEVSVVFQC